MNLETLEKVRKLIATYWTQRQAIDLCIHLEAFAPQYGCHVALTGGCLSKDGPRKDVDIMVYRIRQVDKIDMNGLIMRIAADLAVVKTELHGWVTKLHLADGRCIDLFDPTCDDGIYPVEDTTPDVTLEFDASGFELPIPAGAVPISHYQH